MSEATTKSVNPKQLVGLIKDADQKKSKMQSISGELGERVKNAVENGHLHKGAFGLMVKLYRMEEDRRADFIRSIILYLDICREQSLFGQEHVSDLVDDADLADMARGDGVADEGERDPDTEAAEANAAALEGGIKELDPEDAHPTVKAGRKRKGVQGGEATGSYRVQ